MLFELGLLLAGTFLIIKGSEWLTDAAAPLARVFRTSNIAVGLVLVSALTSLPELLVALLSIGKGHADVGIGVTLGSIIINIGLIIGISAIIRPLKVPRHVITRDAVFMVVATIVVMLIALEDSTVGRRDGFVFLLLYVPYLVNVYEQEKQLAKRERQQEEKMVEKTLELVGKIGIGGIVIKDVRLVFVLGAALLLVGAMIFTDALIGLAEIFAIPGIVIGVTIGAIGPSIPNLAAALHAVKRKYDELAVSETIGANTFTLLVTIGVIAVVSPFTIDPEISAITVPALLIITGMFFIFILSGTISRMAGFVLLFSYIATLILELIAH